MKRQKKKKSNRFTVVFLSLIVILGLGATFYNNNPGSQQYLTSSEKDPYEYRSHLLNLNLRLGKEWSIKEDPTFINLISEPGAINISRIATNFPDLQTYLQDFDSKRTLETNYEESGKINGKEKISRIEILNGGPIPEQKVIYIYVKNWVYSLSTSSESLYDELDQIAKSFRYTP